MWVVGAFSIELLEKQVGALEQNVKMPSTDSDRRLDEFKRYAAEMTHVVVKTPPLRGDCLVTVFHLLTDSSFLGPIEPAHFPMGKFWCDWIDGWSDGDNFQIVPTGVNVSGVNLVLLTAAPLGRVKGACFFGSVPRQHS